SAGQPLVLQGHTDTVNGVAWSPDGGSIASTSWITRCGVWRDLKPITPRAASASHAPWGRMKVIAPDRDVAVEIHLGAASGAMSGSLRRRQVDQCQGAAEGQ